MGKLGDQAVSSIVKLKVNGSATNFIVVQQGNPDPSIYDSSCDGTWLLMEKLPSYYGSSFLSYASSGVNSYLTNSFFPTLDERLQKAVLTAKIPYTQRKSDVDPDMDYKNYRYKGSDGLPVKAFLLSCLELGGQTSDDSVYEYGTVLEYFNGKGDLARAAYLLDGSSSYAQTWWTRSIKNAYSPSTISVNGQVSSSGGSISVGKLSGISSGSAYVRPALILDPDIFVYSSGNVVANAVVGNVSIDGVNKELSGGYANIGGAWKEISGAYMNIDGVWKETT